jgi:hypothetical protein
MTYGTHTERTLSTGLAIHWSLKEGCPQLRWAITKHAKPLRPSWLRWAGEWEGMTPRTAGSGANHGLWSSRLEFLGKLFGLIRLLF